MQAKGFIFNSNSISKRRLTRCGVQDGTEALTNSPTPIATRIYSEPPKCGHPKIDRCLLSAIDAARARRQEGKTVETRSKLKLRVEDGASAITTCIFVDRLSN